MFLEQPSDDLGAVGRGYGAGFRLSHLLTLNYLKTKQRAEMDMGR